VVIFGSHHHAHPPDEQHHGTVTINSFVNADSTQPPFRPSASISYEGIVDLAISASTNILKTREHSLAVRDDHPATATHP
jgi:hypothetical protein